MDRITDTSPDIRVALRVVGYDILHDQVMHDSHLVATINGNEVTIVSKYSADKSRIQDVINKLNSAGGRFIIQ